MQNFRSVDYHSEHFTITTGLRSAAWSVERVAHQEFVHTPDLYMAVSRDAPLGETALDVELFCDELGHPEKLTIPFRVVDLEA